MKRSLVGLSCLAVATGIAALTVDKTRADAAVIGEQISDRILLDYPMEFNFRQSINSCGPYSAAAALRVLGQRTVDSETVATDMPWRMPNGPTMPWGIVEYLEGAGVSAKGYDAGNLSENDRLIFLREQLAAGHPIILLGAAKTGITIQHYVTVVGADSGHSEFYVYDSAHAKDESRTGMTIDDNGNPPGNRTWTNEELLDFWGHGGILGLYDWHAIVASN